jgi:hypothetical protein
MTANDHEGREWNQSLKYRVKLILHQKMDRVQQ